MPDERLKPDELKYDVLTRADGDAELNEQAKMVVLAALQGPEALAEILGGVGARADLNTALAAPKPRPTPVGAYLQSIRLEGQKTRRRVTLRVLTELAADRQVIVLTHDDRLPAAIRASRACARIVEVTRGANSTVHVAESSDPATRLLTTA